MVDLAALADRVEAATGPDRTRFWSKVAHGGEGCWLWCASLTQKGYGQFSFGKKSDGTYRMLKAHRFAYEDTVGPIPEGMAIDHLCRNRACCNPVHLEVVTNAENNKRAGAAKESCARGHRFTPENIIGGRNGTRECRACRLERKRRYRHAARSR